MTSAKVQSMHRQVSGALEELSKIFTPDMKLSFIARCTGNPEGEVIIGDDHDFDALVEAVKRAKHRAEVGL